MNNPFSKLAEQAKSLQQALDEIKVIGEAGAGLVKVEMDGHYQILQLTVEEEIYKEEKAVLLDLIRAAANEATSKVGLAIKDKMAGIAKGFGLPTNFNFPFLS